jgi:cbb3-type cytochrome oxidase maturation protein
VDPLTVLVVVALLIGWIGLFALWWFGFRGRGPD